ncbi:unnamed protein product [Prorocentrum cordatum]|uniref:Uncharacterized protein n=1 Tax=Prorocentrum cordatum TaxID=2364126 RepID=A0ABN9UE52_9DINO|nr:unnamed protein product [Polarella glacialis]
MAEQPADPLLTAAADGDEHAQCWATFVNPLATFLDQTLSWCLASVAQDRESKLEAIADDMLLQAALGRSDLEWKDARRLLNFGGMPNKAGGAQAVPVRQRADGSAITFHSDLGDETLLHFAKIELVTVMDACSMVEKYITSAAHALQDMDMDDRSFMSLLDLVRKVKASKGGNATGPDSLPDGLHKVAPWKLTRNWFPVLLKATLEGQGPIQMKGGQEEPVGEAAGEAAEQAAEEAAGEAAEAPAERPAAAGCGGKGAAVAVAVVAALAAAGLVAWSAAPASVRRGAVEEASEMLRPARHMLQPSRAMEAPRPRRAPSGSGSQVEVQFFWLGDLARCVGVDGGLEAAESGGSLVLTSCAEGPLGFLMPSEGDLLLRVAVAPSAWITPATPPSCTCRAAARPAMQRRARGSSCRRRPGTGARAACGMSTTRAAAWAARRARSARPWRCTSARTM